MWNFFLSVVAGVVELFSVFRREGKRSQMLTQSSTTCWKFVSGREVLIRVFATSNVSEVNLTELGGKVELPQDATPNSVKPSSGKVYWNSDNFSHFSILTLNAAPGESRTLLSSYSFFWKRSKRRNP